VPLSRLCCAAFACGSLVWKVHVLECWDSGDIEQGRYQLVEKGALRKLPFADALAVWVLKSDRLREKDSRRRPLESFRNEDLRRQVHDCGLCARQREIERCR
jgi:hypothetical protein